MRETIEEILMRRDGLSLVEAKELVEEARTELHRRIDEGEMPYDICQEYFGLEPDWLEDLL